MQAPCSCERRRPFGPATRDALTYHTSGIRSQAANRIRAQDRRERTWKADRRSCHSVFRQSTVRRRKGSSRRNLGLQSGHRCDCPQGKAGVLCKGKGQVPEEDRAKAYSKSGKKERVRANPRMSLSSDRPIFFAGPPFPP